VLTLVAACGTVLANGTAASASSPYLYVNNATSVCSDTGDGSSAQPYCTLDAAATAVLPGQTVLIAGTFPAGHLNVVRSGTPASPITFEPTSIVQGIADPVVLNGQGAGITVTGAHDVSIVDIQVSGAGNTGIAITDSSSITLDSVAVSTDTTDDAGIRLAGVSNSSLTAVSATSNTSAGISLDAATSGVVITSAQITANGKGTPRAGIEISGSSNTVTDSRVVGNGNGIAVEAGADGTVVADNEVLRNMWGAGIDNAGARATAITSNVVEQDCGDLLVEGASTGVSVENNIVYNGSSGGAFTCGGFDADKRVGIGVYGAAMSTTTVDYNIAWMQNFVVNFPYAWGTPLHLLTDFQAASGQGAHDIFADPELDSNYVPTSISPAIDSANSAAPGEQDTDFVDHVAVNDPILKNTGVGPVAYRDRGAREYVSGPTPDLVVTGTPPTTSTGWHFTADASATLLWNPVSTYSFDFGDGTVVTQSTPVAQHTYAQLGSYTVTLTVTDTDGRQATTTDVARAGGTYTPAGPVRVLDTRSRVGVSTTTPVAPGGTVVLPVAGVAGVPASGVTAVVLNVTATDPASYGYLTVYPDGRARPTASNLDWTAKETIPNLVTVPVLDGKVDFYNGSAGTVDIVADLEGYFSNSRNGGTYAPAGPVRVLDTRSRVGVSSTTPVAPGGTVVLPVGGVAGVPASGLTAVVLNVTVADPTSYGYLTAYADGQARPTASNLDWTANETIANLVTVPVVDGKVALYNGSAGTVHIIADLAGYYLTVGMAAFHGDVADIYEPINPVRVLDTRDGTGTGAVKAVAPGGTLVLSLASYPVHYATGTNSVLLNVTVTNPKAIGVLTVYPDGSPRPTASNVNWSPSETIANLVDVELPANGKIDFYNSSGGTVDVVADLEGNYQL
jgi:hypothetical protein